MGINSYYRVDDHPPLYGNNGSLDPSTYTDILGGWAPHLGYVVVGVSQPIWGLTITMVINHVS